MWNKLRATSHATNLAFPKGNDPFQMMTRLLEECGELAQQVHHFEDSGVKRQKYGDPDKGKMAKEIMDVLRCLFQVMEYYQVEPEVIEKIEAAYHHYAGLGLIPEADADSIC